MKKTFTRKQVKKLLKKQILKVRNSIGRMPHDATDTDILIKASKCSLIKF